MPTGTAMHHVAAQSHVPLPPRPAIGSHARWCAECKRTGRELNRDDHCATCATVVARRAEAAARPKPAAVAPKPKRPATSRRTYNREEVLRRYAAGESGTKLAAEYGIAPATLHTLACKAGVPHGNRHTGYSVTVEEVVAAYNAGGSLRSVAKDLGISCDAVRRRLQKAGVKRRRPGAPKRNA